jgi:hypothetical protein
MTEVFEGSKHWSIALSLFLLLASLLRGVSSSFLKGEAPLWFVSLP